jgi:DNA-binding NarL/FixJ family response regulator
LIISVPSATSATQCVYWIAQEALANIAEHAQAQHICDDQMIVCEGLRAILEGVGHIEVVGVANNGVDAIDLTRTTQPDLVLMDLKMPRMNGIQATKAICEQFPDVRILVLTTYDEDEWVIDAIRAGAAGYVLKDTPQEDLIKAIGETTQLRRLLGTAAIANAKLAYQRFRTIFGSERFQQLQARRPRATGAVGQHQHQKPGLPRPAAHRDAAVLPES